MSGLYAISDLLIYKRASGFKSRKEEDKGRKGKRENGTEKLGRQTKTLRLTEGSRYRNRDRKNEKDREGEKQKDRDFSGPREVREKQRVRRTER